MKLTLETLQVRHSLILGREPDELALGLYKRFPAQRGYGDTGVKDTPQFEASAVIALAHAFEDKDVRVLFFVPRSCEHWAIERFKDIAKGMFARLKVRKAGMSAEALANVVALYKRVFSQVMIGSEPTQAEPKHWVVYGFLEHDPRLPTWLREGLV